MKKFKMFALAVLAVALVLQGCSVLTAKSSVYENDLSFENLSAVKLASATNSKGGEIKNIIDGNLKSVYHSSSKQDYIEISFSEASEFDTIILRENGWKINAFHIEISEIYDDEEYWKTVYKQDTMEDLRVCSIDSVSSNKIRIVIDDAIAPFSISEVSVYKSNPVKKEMRVTGYLRTYDLARDSYNDRNSSYYIDPEYFSVVNQVILFSGFRMSDGGGIELEDYLQNGEFEKYLSRLDNEIINGKDVDKLITFAVSKNPIESMVNNKEKSINAIVDFLLKNGFKGVNFDWEFPNGKEEYNAFSDFLISLKSALNENNLILSCAFYSWGINLTDEAIKSIDQIEIMGYDIYDRVGNNAGFLGSCVQPIKYFIDKGVSRSAISLGVPIFGRTIDSEPVWRDYDEYNLRKFDNVFFDASEKEMIYFNSAQMIEDKVAYSVFADIGGIMLFHIKNDLPYNEENSLIRTVGKTLDKYTVGE